MRHYRDIIRDIDRARWEVTDLLARKKAIDLEYASLMDELTTRAAFRKKDKKEQM